MCHHGCVRIARLRYRLGAYRLERRRRRFYGRFVSRGDLCFDVGAHVGDRTAILLSLGARVVAVEPQPLCVEKLRLGFANDPGFVLVEAGVGAAPGHAELRVPAGGPAIASMSDEWIERVRASGRFRVEWSDSLPIRLTTLDALIGEYGLPQFCKIDVEGYEPEVLEGLTRPVPALSLEFTPEHLDGTERCLERLDGIGRYEYAYSVGESFRLASGWLARDETIARLEALPERSFGDVYARLTS